MPPTTNPTPRTTLLGTPMAGKTKVQIIRFCVSNLEGMAPEKVKLTYFTIYKPMVEVLFNATQLAANAPTLDELLDGVNSGGTIEAGVDDAKKPLVVALRQLMVGLKAIFIGSGVFAGNIILAELLADAVPYTLPT